MAHDADGRRLVSNSEIETFRDCPRSWWLRYHRGLAPNREPVSGCANAGTLIHRGLEAYYSGECAYSAYDVAIWMEGQCTADVAECGEDALRAEAVRKAHTTAISAVGNYIRWAEDAGVDDGLTFEKVEQEYRMPLTARTALRGKLDLLASSDAWLAVVDHKSVTSFQDEAWVHLRGQFRTYALLAEYDTGHRVTSVEINMVKRAANPKTEPAHRASAPINSACLDAHYRHLRAVVTDMERTEDRLAAGEEHHDVVPPRATRDCTWKCQFFSVCPAFDRGEDAEFLLELDYHQEDPDARYDDPKEES